MREAVWTAIGLSRDLATGAATGVVVEGREWALWRGVSGRVHLWEDRCPHRGMPLSLGFVREDRFGCLYHAWQFDEDGKCRLIPAEPERTPPASIRIRGRAVAESGGVIWACFADAPAAPPDFADALPVRSLYLDAPLAEAKAALGLTSPAPGASDAVLLRSAGAVWLVAAQNVDERHCALHIAAFGEDSARHAARWAAGLRLERESVAAAC